MVQLAQLAVLVANYRTLELVEPANPANPEPLKEKLGLDVALELSVCSEGLSFHK